MTRPPCVVNVADVPGEVRPRSAKAPGVAAVVHTLARATGLTRVGVHQRIVPLGHAGTNRHFHTVEEEWIFVLAGTGTLRLGPLRLPVGPGHFAGFPPGPRPHHLINDGDTPLVFLEGGESRAAEDGCWYPDLRAMTEGRQRIEPYVEPPPEEGDPAQLVRTDDLPIVEFDHDVDAGARRRMRRLHTPTGLVRQAVCWAEVRAGDRSTAFHSHERTDEWVFVLDGSAVAEVGDDSFVVGPGDFVGHPAGGPPHVMEARTNLTYLMGGQIDPADVVSYPRHGVKRVGGRLLSRNGE